MRRVLLIAPMVALLLAVGAHSAIANPVSDRAWVMSACGSFGPRERPSQIAFSCDGNAVVDDIQWNEWGGVQATGTATVDLVDRCEPDCAEAPRYDYSARITARQPLYCGPQRIYSEVDADLSQPDFDDEERLRATMQGCPSVKGDYRPAPTRERSQLLRSLTLTPGCRTRWVRISRLDPRFAGVSLAGQCPEDVVALFHRAVNASGRYGPWQALPGDPADLEGQCRLMPLDVIESIYGAGFGKRHIPCEASAIQVGLGLAFDPASILIGTPTFVLGHLTDILWTGSVEGALLGSGIESGPGQQARDVMLRAYAPSPRCHGISHYTRLRVATPHGQSKTLDWEVGCEAR